MMRILSILAVCTIAACTPKTMDGGKVPWKGRGKSDDVKGIMADAKRNGMAIMMFFTSEG